MKHLLKFTTIYLIILSLYSCDSLEGGGNNGLKGWYVTDFKVPTESNFAKINKALDNNDLVYRKTYYNYPTVEIYAQDLDFFGDNGGFSTYFDYLFGTLENEPAGFDFLDFTFEAIQIIDNNTLYLDYSGYLYNPNLINNNATIFAQTYTGKHLGTLVFATLNDGNYYTYEKQGNKIIVNKISDSGVLIFTITEDGLILDGSSLIYRKKKPL